MGRDGVLCSQNPMPAREPSPRSNVVRGLRSTPDELRRFDSTLRISESAVCLCQGICRVRYTWKQDCKRPVFVRKFSFATVYDRQDFE